MLSRQFILMGRLVSHCITTMNGNTLNSWNSQIYCSCFSRNRCSGVPVGVRLECPKQTETLRSSLSPSPSLDISFPMTTSRRNYCMKECLCMCDYLSLPHRHIVAFHRPTRVEASSWILKTFDSGRPNTYFRFRTCLCNVGSKGSPCVHPVCTLYDKE